MESGTHVRLNRLVRAEAGEHLGVTCCMNGKRETRMVDSPRMNGTRGTYDSSCIIENLERCTLDSPRVDGIWGTCTYDFL